MRLPRHPLSRTLLAAALAVPVVMSAVAATHQYSRLASPDDSHPLIIAHRGASGHVPEHTLASYALGVLEGADYIEPDLVMTKDGHLVARHDNDLGLSTDVAEHPEFANRKVTKTIDGTTMEGWFSEDFTLAELKTLRAIERIPDTRPGNARMDGAFEIPTLQEIIDLVQALQKSQNRSIGLYIETKHPTYFQNRGLAMEEPLVSILRRNGYNSPQDPVYLQSFEVRNLQALNQLTRLRLVQLFGSGQPYDQAEIGSSLTYAEMATAEGLQQIARYAEGVGPSKGYIIPRDPEGNLGAPTDFVANAHAANLLVHPFTFRAENSFLPTRLRSSDNPMAYGDLEAEIEAYLDAGIDGLFTDNPNIGARVRDRRTED